MKRLTAFLRLWGDFDDPYTYLIWACILLSVVLPAKDPRWLVLLGVELVTVAMRIWTRDVRAEQVKRKQQRKEAR
jgi:hypothetical protein